MRIKKNIINKLKLAEKAEVYSQLTGIKVTRFADNDVAMSKLVKAIKEATPAVIEKKLEKKYQDILGIQNAPTDKGKLILAVIAENDGCNNTELLKAITEAYEIEVISEACLLTALRNLYEPYFITVAAGAGGQVYKITDKGERYLQTEEFSAFKELFENTPQIVNFTKIDWYAPGPESGFALKRLYRSSEDGENPRKPGSHGYNSYELIVDGISYEEYKIAGGRTNDIMWDYKNGDVEISKEIRID